MIVLDYILILTNSFYEWCIVSHLPILKQYWRLLVVVLVAFVMCMCYVQFPLKIGTSFYSKWLFN